MRYEKNAVYAMNLDFMLKLQYMYMEYKWREIKILLKKLRELIRFVDLVDCYLHDG